MLLIPTFASEMSGVLSKLLDEQFLPLVAQYFSNTPYIVHTPHTTT